MEVRVCLGCMTPDKDEKFKSIIQKNGKLAQLILELTNLKITNLKESPALMCSKCIKELKRAISFRESLIKNYQKMFNSDHKVDKEIQIRLKIESEDLDPSEFILKSFCNQTSDNLTTIDSELFQSEDPINENELEDSKIEVTLIKQEPIDDEQLDIKFSNPSTESESNDSTSDELPLKTFLKNKTEPQITSFLCQKCGQIANRTCKFCKTKVIPRHECDKIKQRERILEKYLENPKARISDLSRLAQAPRTTVKRTIQAYKTRNKIDRKPGSGRKVGTGNIEREQKIFEALRLDPDLGVRKLARMFGTSHGNIYRIKLKGGFICDEKKGKKKAKKEDCDVKEEEDVKLD